MGGFIDKLAEKNITALVELVEFVVITRVRSEGLKKLLQIND